MTGNTITELCKQLTDEQSARIERNINSTCGALDRMQTQDDLDRGAYRSKDMFMTEDKREDEIRESLCRQILAAVDHSHPKIRAQALRIMLDITSDDALRHLSAALLSPHNEHDHTHLAVLEIRAQLAVVIGSIRGEGFESFEMWCK